MAKRRSIASELRIGQIDDDELAILLTARCPRAAQFRSNEVEYRDAEDEVVLTLIFQNEAVVDAIAGPKLTPDLERELRESIEGEVTTSHEKRVWRFILFSGRPVAGYWRYRDDFQIVPAPSSAARPDEIPGANPFVLDVSFRTSANSKLQERRWRRRAHELSLVLDLAVRTAVTAPSIRSPKHWMCVPSEPEPRWLNEGYWIPEFEHLCDALPSVEEIPTIGEVPAAMYHSRNFFPPTDDLYVPSELADLIRSFDALGGDLRDRFLRACYWQQTSHQMWDHSHSLYLTSLINSVETLASVGPERTDHEGPSKLFKKFMKKFAPGNPSGTTLDGIYDARSHVTHGERLMYMDRPTTGVTLDERSARDTESMDNARLLTKGALLNWLWQYNPGTSGHLVTEGVKKGKAAPPGTKSRVQVVLPKP